MNHTRVFRDANHLEIVADLRQAGYAVIDLAAVGHSVPDILVANHSHTILIEIKLPDGGRFYLDQLAFLANWPGIAGFAECTEDCLELFKDPFSRLTEAAKTAIGEIVRELRNDDSRDKKLPRVTVKKFEKLLAEKMRG